MKDAAINRVEKLLRPNEEILWEGRTWPKAIEIKIALTTACFLVGIFWLFGPSEIFGDSLLWKMIGLLLALPLFGFLSLQVLGWVNSKTAVITSQRIFNINKLGGVSPISGFEIDRSKTCNFTARGAFVDLDIHLVQTQSSDPAYFSLGRLEKDVAAGISDTIIAEAKIIGSEFET